jgi:hypothetical protein
LDSLLPPVLYKFRAINRDKPAFVSRIFTHGELYFPRAIELNDPWESRPRIKAPLRPESTYTYLSSADDSFTTMPREFAELVHKELFPHEHHKWSFDARHAAKLLHGLFSDTSRSPYTEHFRLHPTFRLCSFAANRTHPLLWSHYANGHTGFCIGFSTAVEPFERAERITYQRAYPLFPSTKSAHDLREAERRALLHKSDIWSYEDEYRLLTGLYGGDEPSLLNEQHLLCVPPDAIVSVTFGCAMRDDDRQRVRDWLAQRPSSHPVTIYESRPDTDLYILNFSELPPS